jgi:FtsH-binding integral membrane protein
VQTIATRVFVISSVAFGAVGTLFFLTTLVGDLSEAASEAVFALWGVIGCVVLSSFALSVAGKYLTDKID